MRDMRTAVGDLFSANQVVLLHAHPDDESFLTAGIINELSCLGKKILIIYTAAGIKHGKSETYQRQKEAREACTLLGLNSVFFIDFLDRKYLLPNFNYELDEMAICVEDILHSNFNTKEQIVLVTYDANGGYGHPDHIIVNRIGEALVRRQPKLVLLEATMNRTAIIEWLKKHGTLNKEQIPEVRYWSVNFGLPDSEIHCFLELSGRQLELKHQALSNHKTQMDISRFPLSLSKGNFKSFFGKEYLRICKAAT